jgi:SEC-C motif
VAYARAPVPHAHHFLERLDRVTREQMEFALGLYRDHEAVRFLLGHVNLPPAAQRVALAIGDEREGPFVIVTLDGRFVTCLGKGMRQDHPVVPRGQVDALLAKVADKRARRELAELERRPDEDDDDFFQRVLVRGSRFAREDFLAISAFEPALGATSWGLMLQISGETARASLAMLHEATRTTVIKKPLARALQNLDRLEWAVAHLMVLSCAGERRDLDAVLDANGPTTATPTLSCSIHHGVTFFMRSAWAAARLGRAAIPRYKQVLAETQGWVEILDAGLGLGAIALRHAGTEAEIRRTLLSYEKPREDATATMETARGGVAHAVAHTIEVAREYEERALALGRDTSVTLSGHLPEGHASRFARAEDVPESLARTSVLTLDLDTWDPSLRDLVFALLPTAARASAEDFYFPREVVRAWRGAWQPEEGLERVARLGRLVPKQEPVRKAVKVGRNDPCPCGSGKKAKRCHPPAGG